MKKLLAPLACLLLAGCASPNHPLSANYWQHKQSVKVSHDIPMHAAVYHEGSQGLVDMAINNAVTSKFDHYLATYNLASVRSIQKEFIQELHERGVKASRFRQIDIHKLQKTHLDDKQFTTRNFKPYKISLGKSKLLIISTNLIGAERRYYSVIPLGAPKASCTLEGRLIDTKSNKILWRYTSPVKLAVVGKWDQPPRYPNFTKTLKRAIALSKENLIEQFFMDAPN